MGTVERLRSVGTKFRREITVYREVLRHPGTPRPARILLGVAVGYMLLPFDLIPDFIPVLGHVDDAILVPLLVVTALKRIPADVISECRATVEHRVGSSTA